MDSIPVQPTTTADDFYRPPREVNTTEELARRQELTQSITSNLHIIRSDTTDLDALAHKLADVATALMLLRGLTDEMNLPELERRLASISACVRLIEADDTVQELKAER